ncbi:tripartite tricarboxylate transporter TctB family protein [Consotaella aegiceratis]|uniref:tripartite tricarboxylate transporter TctB family protein n=1 Tax=Consotaella aegiceratis TaxID=3097961 RepID=UPI002F41F39F
MSEQSLFHVTVDFDTSHLIFPTIIGTILAILLVVVLVTRARTIAQTLPSIPRRAMAIDHVRFFGTLGITIVYFLAMPEVGDLFPNTGLGFYICSIPYIFLLGVLYRHDWSPRSLIGPTVNAVLAPTVVWYLLSELFNISLP